MNPGPTMVDSTAADRADMLIFNVVSWNGVLVRAMRDAKGLDKQGFAALIGVSGTAVAKWEMDGADAGLSHAPQLKLDHILNTLDTDARTRFTQLANAGPELSIVDKRTTPKLVITSPTRTGDAQQRLPDTAAGCVAVESGQPAVVLAVPVGFWDDPDIAKALRTRDIAAVFRFLQDRGLSQRVISRYTGQAQSEVSEILAGRVIRSYDVLVRIAVGLGIPRGRLGLAYNASHTAQLPVGDAHGGGAAPVVEVAVFETPRTGRGGAGQDPQAVGRGERRRPTASGSAALLATVSGMDAEESSAARSFLASTLTRRRDGLVTMVTVWSGLHVRVRRLSMRMSVRDFGEYLGVSDRMITKFVSANAVSH
jgi:transcriptional regulator with XRE-family HTH domain